MLFRSFYPPQLPGLEARGRTDSYGPRCGAFPHQHRLLAPLESQSWIESTAEWLFRSNLKKLLQERANLFLDQSFRGLKDQLQLALNRPLATGIQLKGTVSEIHLGQVRVLEDRFRVDAFLDGQLSLEVTVLPVSR